MQQKKNREVAMGDALLGIMFLICVICFSCAGLLMKDKKLSESENRSLAEKPELSMSSVLRGSYEEELETYLSDQFVFRLWVFLKHFTVRHLRSFCRHFSQGIR